MMKMTVYSVGIRSALLALVSLVTPTAVADLVYPPSSPILHYSFDDSGNIGYDDSGNGHDLTIPGSWSQTTHHGSGCGFDIGSGVQFDYYDPSGSGTNPGSDPFGPYASTSGMAIPGVSGFTAAYWTKVEAGNQGILQDYKQHVSFGQRFGLKAYADQDRIYFEAFHDATTPTVAEVSAAAYLAEEWTHVAGVYDPIGNLAKLYLNGILVNQQNMPAPMRTDIAPYLYVGGSWHQTEHSAMDEVLLYDRAFSDSEVYDLYCLPEPGSILLLALGLIVATPRRNRITG